MKRYVNPVIAEHLASNYVLGLLKPRTKKRLQQLLSQTGHSLLQERITYWENKLAPLDQSTPELTPLPQSWEAISAQLNLKAAPAKLSFGDRVSGWLSAFNSPWPAMATLSFCFMIGLLTFNQSSTVDPLSYIAVLESDENVPQVVASTYGDSKNLVLDIIELPQIESQESFELWVTSKTDNQTRSLGEIPKDMVSFQRKLSQAEWRLIVDSSYLIISIEDEGGSAIGEPSERILSRGLCIRLSGWQEQA